MRSKPIVSVVMPVLNPHPVYFRQAIESVLNQTFEDWELVIVEDPSPRPAAEILKDYPDPRIRHFVRSQRTSLGDAMNLGLREARAELVAILHADDISEPERLEKQVKFMESHPEVAVLGTWLRVIDEDGQTLGFRRYPCDHDDIVRAMRIYNSVGHPSVMFQKKVVLEAGGYADIDLVEDYELWCRLAKRGAQFAALPEALVRYRVHLGSLSKGTKVRDVVRASIKVKQTYWGDERDAQMMVRLLAEKMSLLLPPRLIVWLFLKTSVKP